MKLFDVHAHMQFPEYDADRDAVMLRTFNAGVGIINVGTDQESSKKAIELAEKYLDCIYASVGLHPTDNEKEVFDYNFYKNLALSSKKVVAIGECGLDYFRIQNSDLRIKQKETFKKHIRLARNIGKPIMIHCREAFPDLISVLKSEIKNLKSSPGVIHFFSGSIDNAKTLLALGFSFSFGGVVTFTRDYDEVIKFIPIDRILLETDAPYVAPIPYRGNRNEPLYVVETAKKIAEIKGATFDEVARVTTYNAISLFGLID